MSLHWGLVVLLVVLWILGISVNIGGGLINLLIVLAVIVVAYNVLVGRRSRI